MATTNLAIRVDYENNAEEWWSAAREAARADTSRGAEVFRKLNRVVQGGELRGQLPEAVRAFEEWAAALPGYEDGPEHARHPFNVYEDDGEE